MSSPTRRRDMDIMKLMMSDFDVRLKNDDSPNEFYVKFHGPKNSVYETGIWKIHVTLPANYPYRSPSIGFMNRIYHPNIDETSGSVCLDVINQTWSPMFELLNIFNVFLPQLLMYSNPGDPLNGEAASLLLSNKEDYEKKVRDYVKKYASEDFSNQDEESESENYEDDDDFMDEDEEFSDIDDMDMSMEGL